ncbi:hypothetical protein MtrunA17_Chr4g0024281 [Medicago truncatula]|uniref:Uncharacterized protein n=1 Tax=Medicago truncatula TaxID=3880 RepID=A0A396I6E0_MEDTR|nr:hypothetical protein MtrunA17_Chr4g0024281 [Medicago truncatula]
MFLFAPLEKKRKNVTLTFNPGEWKNVKLCESDTIIELNIRSFNL